MARHGNRYLRPGVMRTMAGVALALALGGCGRTLEQGPPPMEWGACQAEQVEVLILGTFHFAQIDAIDILEPRRQSELANLLDRLETFRPDRVTVEYPWARNDALNEQYRRWPQRPADSLATLNEFAQIGFRLARRLGHDSVFGIDVPMNLWHDSIAVFDSLYPGARGDLRRRWNVRYPDGPDPNPRATLAENLQRWNGEAPPTLPEYGRFLPLVKGEAYAGALKLRPWYDRNLRTVQNMFRVLRPDDDRLLLVIGGSHVRILRQIMELTPQLCAVDPLPYLTGS